MSNVAQYIEREARRAFPKDARLRARLLENIAQNLAAKRALPRVDGKSFVMTAEALKRTVVDYEAFKLRTFLSSGVFPKRYFGYFDEQWDTAIYERSLREVVHKAVTIINAAQGRKGAPTRVSDIEVAITFVAEGGAILLREQQAQIEDIHPVYGVGLDDIATGLTLYKDLAAEFDAAFGTGLRGIVSSGPDGRPYLYRNMRFREAILGTALMYIYEKELAAAKLHEAEGKHLAELSLDEQFIIGSLVYNSGRIFSRRSRELLRTFATAEELFTVSTKNARTRPLLPVLQPAAALHHIASGGGYPEQATSWSALYHVLQRYGGYQAMRRFTDVFDETGMFRRP